MLNTRFEIMRLRAKQNKTKQNNILTIMLKYFNRINKK